MTIIPGLAAPIPAATTMDDLARLADEDKFASVDHHLPSDYMVDHWEFIRDGVVQPKGLLLVSIYAPGDETGWAEVVQAGETQVIPGDWRFHRV